jgi:hypothetical protein
MVSARQNIFCVLFAVIPVMAFAMGGCDQGPRSLDGGEDPGTDGRDTADTIPDVPTDGRDVPDIQGDDVPVTACVPPCTEGSCCAGTCVVLGSDPDNCGTCGNACPEGQVCLAGTCQACTPDCAGKTCGDDGCGGRCGLCGADEACIDGNCVPCSGSCEGKDCGDDGCGHSCGTCPEGQECSAGTCIPCTANCTGKDCGDDDGCGGYCDGDCPAGGTCDDGLCVGGCVPGCSGKECGNDGCGGKCGDCDYPEKCGRGGVCECTSLCTTEGRQCGFDGCGSSCGTCPEGQICADGDSGAVVATYLCLDFSTGCADGVREGFTNQEIYPDIASCLATWEEQSMRTTRTGALCGNNLGPCMVPEDACAPGWHLCMKNGWPGDLADRVSGEDCGSPIAGDTRFLGGSSVQDESGGCTLPLTCNNITYYNGVVCCGSSCLDYCSVSGPCNCVWSGMSFRAGWPCDSVYGDSVNSGALCCQDPPVVGH